ncbi:hypothetical protein NEISICOT_00880 [Neisseria sicca ATCC 29256]|uniref:Uncharacterized protein n=1 Tax=Neisseria sicca ATCC 29256 TaxID=547045 RepID=C6M2Y9_NEISI|nr:hypothetical protein NEISICOT_00880 [Neisseria sicca ATCC 29256]
MPRLAVLFVLSAASSPCPDLNLIHYMFTNQFKRSSENLSFRVKYIAPIKTAP